MDRTFVIALRGYDITQVDRLLDRAESAVGSGDRRLRATMADELRSADFRQRLRGYDRAAVDRAVEELLRELA
ncbi:MAG TPA: DivIVA domain-containing protein [Mycobacteriales bacterium]